jgi:hypothetical protein
MHAEEHRRESERLNHKDNEGKPSVGQVGMFPLSPLELGMKGVVGSRTSARLAGEAQNKTIYNA